MDEDDAVSVIVMLNIIEQQLETFSRIVPLLRTDIDNNTSKINGMESHVQARLSHAHDEMKTTQNLVTHTSDIISQLEARVTTLEATVHRLTVKENLSDSVNRKKPRK